MKKKLFILFFVVMLILTFLARVIDSLVIPKVQVVSSAAGNLEYAIEGEGVIRADTSTYLDIPEGIKVDRVLEPGETVEEGQGILFLRLTHLEEKKKELEREVLRQELTLERERLNGKTPAGLTQQELLAGEQKQVQKSLEQAQEELQKAQGEKTQAQKELEEKQRRDKELEQDRLDISKHEIDQANANTVSGNVPSKNYDQAELAYRAAVAAIEDSYQSMLDQMENPVQTAEQTLKDKQNAAGQMQDSAELAAKKDAAESQNENTSAQISQKNQELIVLDLEAQKEKLQQLDELIQAGGEVKARVSGVITRMDVIPGGITAGNEIVEIGSGALFLKGTLSQEGAELLEKGDVIDVLIPSTTNNMKGEVTNIGIKTETADTQGAGKGAELEGTKEVYGEFTAKLGEGEYRIGSTASYSMKKSTEMKYPSIIPLQALRQDGQGTYCLIAETQSTILGEEEIAVRINVGVIKKNATHAAINSVFTGQDLIITGSNKAIEEGDRVRINS